MMINKFVDIKGGIMVVIKTVISSDMSWDILCTMENRDEMCSAEDILKGNDSRDWMSSLEIDGTLHFPHSHVYIWTIAM